ncbi:hypothetical protein ACFSTE_01745 [Aquimarina hainanensis]|uniref:Uncharacterized protein n=1 Tax=Aquimarina hainanensis TaxID=1578017 RepID=A0ABW5N387_9FLAO|nr:hypothetical protein [Aquimarina sp. TRL1]QKX04357.1 hypothetical protein HN014_05345 [Aquimarina sp. TRL1]
MIRSFSTIFIISILCFIGCKQEQSNTGIETEETIVLDSLAKEKNKIKILKLSPQAEKDLESYKDFDNLRKLIRSLNNSNAYYTKKYADSIDLLIDTFNENLTKELKVNPISSRMVVLSTESGLLNELKNRKKPVPEKLLEAKKKLVIAYNSLVIQLNELSLAIPDNIEKELLRDSKDIRESDIE